MPISSNSYSTALFAQLQQEYRHYRAPIPSRQAAADFLKALYDFFFPSGAPVFDKAKCDLQWQQLHILLKNLLLPLAEVLPQDIENLSDNFFGDLPAAYQQLLLDQAFFFESDPAATSKSEIALAYPGFYAISVYRIAHILYCLKVPLLPRLFAEMAHSATGIDIHPGARIESPFFIDHGTGVVIGETAHIGKQVKIYQGVTLGALSVEKTMAGSKRHPTIGDRVILYAGSTILGGDTLVGNDTIIGGNVWLTQCVAPFSVVYHRSEVHIRSAQQHNAALDWVI